MEKEHIELIKKIPSLLRQLKEENTKLAAEIEENKRKELAEDIVYAMDSKGLGDPNLPFKIKVAALLSSDKNLHQMKEAINMTGTNLKLGKVSDESSNSNNSFEDYILGV